MRTYMHAKSPSNGKVPRLYKPSQEETIDARRLKRIAETSDVRRLSRELGRDARRRHLAQRNNDSREGTRDERGPANQETSDARRLGLRRDRKRRAMYAVSQIRTGRAMNAVPPNVMPIQKGKCDERHPGDRRDERWTPSRDKRERCAEKQKRYVQ